MKNVKRWLALGMAAMMTAGVLAGCGSTSTDTASDSSRNNRNNRNSRGCRCSRKHRGF